MYLYIQGEEGALSMTTKARSMNASKGLPVNYCAGFRSVDMPVPYEVDGAKKFQSLIFLFSMYVVDKEI